MPSTFRGAAIFVMASLLFHAPSALAFDEVRLEGVMYEPDRPKDSMAIINGEVLHQGDEYQGMTVDEIGRDFVVLQPKDSDKKVRARLRGASVKLPKAQAEASAPIAEPAIADTKPAASLPMPSSADAALIQERTGVNPFDIAGVINYATEVGVMADLRKLATAAAVFEAEEGGFSYDAGGNMTRQQTTVSALIERGMLAPSFAEKRGNYTFTIEPGQKGGCQVRATPLNGSGRHFLVDEWGDMHAEKGRPATVQSPNPVQ